MSEWRGVTMYSNQIDVPEAITSECVAINFTLGSFSFTGHFIKHEINPDHEIRLISPNRKEIGE